ncbi:hypothetical protein A2U01_0085935, partial [Trifolium medium]|nr:hypothetical protein [Trifolium medium]
VPHPNLYNLIPKSKEPQEPIGRRCD